MKVDYRFLSQGLLVENGSILLHDPTAFGSSSRTVEKGEGHEDTASEVVDSSGQNSRAPPVVDSFADLSDSMIFVQQQIQGDATVEKAFEEVIRCLMLRDSLPQSWPSKKKDLHLTTIPVEIR
jgi:hypothetical protein